MSGVEFGEGEDEKRRVEEGWQNIQNKWNPDLKLIYTISKILV